MPVIDGIATYDSVKATFGSKRTHLLIGNGFSIGCDPLFKYESLYKSAVQAGLSLRAQAVFGRIGTNNFEGVMRLLADTHFVACQYGQADATWVQEVLGDIRVVQETLIRAVAGNHLPNAGSVSDSKKASAWEFFSPYWSVFTTNYDLVAYWVNMSVQPARYQDGFHEDPDDRQAPHVVFSERLGEKRAMYYLHGALHLHLAHGELRKHCWSRTATPLTELIRAGLEKGSYPLFVAEGKAEQKHEQIQRVGYLWYCLNKLGRIEGPLVVYGHSLDESDQHLLDVIIENTKLKHLWIGSRGGPESASSRRLRAIAEQIVTARDRLRVASGSHAELTVGLYDSDTANVWERSE